MLALLLFGDENSMVAVATLALARDQGKGVVRLRAYK
jgi:hypothetical protein